MTMHDRNLTAAHRAFHTKEAGAAADDQLEVKALRAALETRDAEIKAFAEKAASEIKEHGKILADTTAALTALAKSGTDTQAQLILVEQKLARRGGSEGPAVKSLGQTFTESDEWKGMKSRGGGTARIGKSVV